MKHFRNLELIQSHLKDNKILDRYKQFQATRNLKDYSAYLKALAQQEEYSRINSLNRMGPLWIRFGRQYQSQEFQDAKYYIRLAKQNKTKSNRINYSRLLAVGFLTYMAFQSLDILINIEFNQIPLIETIKKQIGDPKQHPNFDDVIGIDEYKEELEEIVDYLKNPKKYTISGAKLPKGILLVGAPGTGKTLLARALANEAECTFIYRAGSQFDEMYAGVGAQRVRALFQEARQSAPAIIFIDEIDSIGGKRKEGGYQNQTINQMLMEMDGFKQDDAIIIIGATNYQSSLDPALTRAGRFDKTISVPPPDKNGRQKLFEYYLKEIKYQTIDTNAIARQTTGLTGADIKNIVNVAILNAIKDGRKSAEDIDFQHAIDRMRMGIQHKITNHDKQLTAYHEGGHALVSILTEEATPLYKVTILPRGGALGFTSLVPKEDQLALSKQQIQAQIDVCMGGRAAEEIQFGNENITTGCSDDLAKATRLAYQYVNMLGMGTQLISDGKTSKKYDFIIDKEVNKLLMESYQRVKQLLLKQKNKLDQLANELLDRETLSQQQVKLLLNIV